MIAFVLLTTIAASLFHMSSYAQERHQLEELVVIAGKHKHKKMFGTGKRIPCSVASLTAERTGYEIGSIIKSKHLFEIEEICFNITSNKIKGVILGVEIYRIDSLFTKVLPSPILIDIPIGSRQRISVTPNVQTIIEPGEYFVAVQFVDCDEEYKKYSEVEKRKNHLLFPLYLKKSFIRNEREGKLEKFRFNLGLKIRGIEYR